MRGPGLVLDLDGTLVDSVESITRAFAAAVAEGGHAPIPEALVRARIGEPLVAMFEDLLAVPEKEADALAAVYREHYAMIAPRLVKPLPGVPDLLDAWGLPMAVATTKRTDQAELVLDALGLRYRFVDVIGIDRAAGPKPHPAPVLEAALSLGLPPSRSGGSGPRRSRARSGSEAPRAHPCPASSRSR